MLYIIGSHESPRFNEQLTFQDEYKKHGTNYHAYIKEIAHELQLYGGNSIANHIRGEIQRFEKGRYADIFFSAKDGPFAVLNSILKAASTDDRQGIPYHYCPRQDGPVARPAENTRLGRTPVGYLGEGLRVKVSLPVQVIPKPG